MNEHFKLQFQKNNISAYLLAKNSGIPYTTISELVNGKIDINKCASATVQRLSVALQTDMKDLLNPISYLEGVRGRYRNISYTWIVGERGDMQLQLLDHGQTVVIDGEGKFENASSVQWAPYCAELAIDRYCQQKELEKIATQLQETANEPL